MNAKDRRRPPVGPQSTASTFWSVAMFRAVAERPIARSAAIRSGLFARPLAHQSQAARLPVIPGNPRPARLYQLSRNTGAAAAIAAPTCNARTFHASRGDRGTHVTAK